jgi:Flp pilus assembly protein TadG
MTMGRAGLRRKLGGSRRLLLAEERGVALVEFALLLPFFLVLLFGMLDIGKAVNYWNDQTHLANEAARYAAVGNSPDPNWAGSKTTTAYKLNTAIKNQAETTDLKNGGTPPTSIQSPGVSICIWFPNKHTPVVPADYAAGQPVQVVVTAQYNWLGFLFKSGSVLKANQTMRATSTMRLEQPYQANGNDAYNTGPQDPVTGAPSTVTDGSGTCS